MDSVQFMALDLLVTGVICYWLGKLVGGVAYKITH